MILKDFQKATVKHVVRKLDKNNRFLVADEVGLGKTIIARGVIEALYKKHRQNATKPFHVIYICSNQVLAHQNISKLNIEGSDIHDAYSRLFLMIKHNEEQADHKFMISTLTPDTSFRMKKSKGTAEERAILYKILRENVYGPGDRKISFRLKKLLKGDCEESWENWWTKGYREEVKLKKGVVSKILSIFKRNGLLSDLDKFFNDDSSERDVDLIIKMRSSVTSVVIDHYLSADLFILDEFQRFNDLIRVCKDDEVKSELQETAERIFNGDRKILLLSATPFKQYTTQWEIENEEEHFSDFEKVLSFLEKNKKTVYIKKISDERQRYITATKAIKWDNPDSVTMQTLQDAKESLTSLYLEKLSRTERGIVEKTSLISEKSIQRINPKSAGVSVIINSLRFLCDNFAHKRYTHQLIEFSKSTPFPFSFLNGYKLYEDLSKKNLVHSKQYLTNCVSYEDWNNYTFDSTRYSSKMESLLQSNTESHGELLLWILPSVPYYKPPAPFDTINGFSKTLIFSQWTMVPRAISSIISYEMERKLLIEADNQTRYFINKKDRRKPTPKLVFRSDENSDVSSNSILLYPSPFIAENLDFIKNKNTPLEEVITNQIKKLKKVLPFKGTSRAAFDRYWNWFSLFFLDMKNGDPQDVNIWLDSYPTKGNIADEECKKNTKENKGLNNFVRLIKERVENIDYESTNTMPENIHEIIAFVSVASPAVCSYRALIKTFPDIQHENLLWYASQMASGFRTMFNKPESILIIQKLIPGNDPYWLKCLKYAAMGNIQSMLDEYLYLLSENEPKLEDAVKLFVSTITTRNSTLEMDFSKKNRKLTTEKVRCHYAAPYGTQKLNTETGENRMVGIREVFNSPFRPFILTTTSIGQEGLDFHWYCRNIYHWNLPHNPIDLEQREGRITRYKSHVIRLNQQKESDLAEGSDNTGNVWSTIFEDIELTQKGKKREYCDLVPYWHINSTNDHAYKIERTVPIYAFSRDEEKYDIILKVLALYRMTFGQPNQEQIMHGFLEETAGLDPEHIKKIVQDICINLAPISFQKN